LHESLLSLKFTRCHCCFSFNHFNRCVVMYQCSLMYISLAIGSTEHLFMLLFPIFVSSSVNGLFIFLSIFPLDFYTSFKNSSFGLEMILSHTLFASLWFVFSSS
jgi:hypothetical protein